MAGGAVSTSRPCAQGAGGVLTATEAHYETMGEELCRRAGLTCDDLRMRMEAAGTQAGRVRVWREIEREAEDCGSF